MATPNAKIQKFLPRRYQAVLGKNLNAIYEAINNNVAVTEELMQACIDQLFLTTASGSFLIRLGEEKGFIMPENSGLDIRSYRVLVPIMAAAPKQVRISIDELVGAFYQDDATKPKLISTIPGPYNLADGDDLIIETESGEVSVSIVESQVSDINNVSAQEVASLLNVSQDLYTAEALTDRATGLSSVKIINKSFGTGSYIRVAGGKTQNVFGFPNLADTAAESGTNWNLTKTSIYNDELQFQWDGFGTNPKIYNVNKGDVVTIRGFVDGAQNFSVLNGSFEVIDSGYDYFVVRNELFDVASSSVTNNDNNVVFTKKENITIFDFDEFALTTETKGQTITITVPAVPPLVRRFLSGSAHLRGERIQVSDFTRGSLTLFIEGEQIPAAENQFLIGNRCQRPNFAAKYFKSEIVSSDLVNPEYSLVTADEDFATFPFTQSTVINQAGNDIYAEVEEPDLTLEFNDYRHGLQHSWAFTLEDFVDGENITAALLNQEHVVKNVVNENKVVFRIKDANGLPVSFDGIPFSAANIIRYTTLQADGSDFYLDFGSESAATASGLVAGMTFVLDKFAGTNMQPQIANDLRYKKLTVTSTSGAFVNFSGGLGPGPQGLIALAVPGARSGYIGGTDGKYYFDKTSTYNQERVFRDLIAFPASYTKPDNELYLGPYMYDPEGEKTNITVSKFLVKLDDNIIPGESRTAIFVDDSTLADGEEFPQSGEIVFSYGGDKEEGPVKYLAFVSNAGSTQILVDPAYKFQKAHSQGAEILYIRENRPYEPFLDGLDYPFYITGTTSTRNVLFQLAELLVASGIFVERDVILPELRYENSAIPPFE